jgi:5-methylcytosine-specific restriction protein A
LVPIARELEVLTGLVPEVSDSPDGAISTWRFKEFPRPFGLEIKFKYELGVARASLTLDTLAASLLEAINELTKTNWLLIESLLLALDKNRISIQVLNGGKAVSARHSNFDGTLEIHGKAVSNSPDEAATELLSSIISLFGFMAGDASSFDPSTFEVEGSMRHVQTRKYERSKFNRNIAIQLHGERCLGCGFHFREVYGDVGAGVIEVHHLIPVHLMEQARVVDPRTELVPLCSNCHTIVHKKDPPFTLSQLQFFVGGAKNS